MYHNVLPSYIYYHRYSLGKLYEHKIITSIILPLSPLLMPIPLPPLLTHKHYIIDSLCKLTLSFPCMFHQDPHLPKIQKSIHTHTHTTYIQHTCVQPTYTTNVPLYQPLTCPPFFQPPIKFLHLIQPHLPLSPFTSLTMIINDYSYCIMALTHLLLIIDV